MVAIKQAPISPSLELKSDDSAQISSSAIRRGDNEQRVSSVRGEAQKKAKELLDKLLLDKTRQRKKTQEEPLAPALWVPAMAINSLPLSAPVKLHFVQPLVSEHLTAGAILAPLPEVVAKQSLRAEKTPAKLVGDTNPTVMADKKNGPVVADTFTQPKVIPQENRDPQFAALPSTDGDHPAMLKVSAPAFSTEGDKAVAGEEHKEAIPHTPASVQSPDMPQVVTRDALFATAEAGRESDSSAHLADNKEHTQGDERPLGWVTPQSTTSAAMLNEVVEIKAPSQPSPESVVAEGMMGKGEPMTEQRTLSYTFSQLKNSPKVTIELSGAGELTAMTTSAEVQQALQENYHLLESEKPLYFRDDEQDKERRGRQQSEQEDEA